MQDYHQLHVWERAHAFAIAVRRTAAFSAGLFGAAEPNYAGGGIHPEQSGGRMRGGHATRIRAVCEHQYQIVR